MDYQKTFIVLRASEQALVGRPPICSEHPTLQAYVDTVLGGPWLVLAGAGMLFKRLGWVLVTGVTFAFTLAAFGEQSISQSIGPAFVFALGVVYFSLPSRSLAATVKPEHVDQVREIILSVADDLQGLQLLHEGTSILRAHTMESLRHFNVVAGIGWGVLFWYAATHALAPGLSAEVVGRGLSYGLMGSLAFGFIVLAGSCRGAAVRAVYQTVEFALLEAKGCVQLSSRNDDSGFAKPIPNVIAT